LNINKTDPTESFINQLQSSKTSCFGTVRAEMDQKSTEFQSAKCQFKTAFFGIRTLIL